MASAPEANRKALKVGKVEAENVFAIGDESDDDDDSSMNEDGGANDPGSLITPPKDSHSPPSDQGITGVSNNETEAVAKPPEADDAKSSADAADESRLRASRNSEYWIKPGDTLVGIALKFGVDVSQRRQRYSHHILTNANRLLDFEGPPSLQNERTTSVYADRDATPPTYADHTRPSSDQSHTLTTST